jgi:nucleotide-binding universal stress UspA family protein
MESMGSHGSGSAGGARPRVAVGVDPSDEARAALEWALRYAALLGATVDVVHGWQSAREYVWLNEVPAPDDPTRTARQAIEQLVSEGRAATGIDEDQVAVTIHVVEGRAVRVLLDQAEGADLLVLGSRGHGGFAGLLLGSVSTECATHASCSVTIVRPVARSSDH